MFSVHAVTQLAQDVCSVKATAVPYDREALLRHVLSGGYALVPYDSSANHEPTERNGESAHWAAIRGLTVLWPS